MCKELFLDLLESVIPECFYRESRRDQTGPPIKTFGGDAFGVNSHCYVLIPRKVLRVSSTRTIMLLPFYDHDRLDTALRFWNRHPALYRRPLRNRFEPAFNVGEFFELDVMAVMTTDPRIGGDVGI